MWQPTKYRTVGTIVGVRGAAGSLVVRLEGGHTLEPGQRVFVAPPLIELAETVVEDVRARGSELVVRLSGAESADLARRLKGRRIQARELASDEAGGEEAARGLVGARVVDEDGDDIGRVVEVIELKPPAPSVLVIVSGNEEILVPEVAVHRAASSADSPLVLPRRALEEHAVRRTARRRS